MYGVSIRTGFIPRWSAFLGYGLALLLVFRGRSIDGLVLVLVLPLWVLLISVFILIDNLWRAGPE